MAIIEGEDGIEVQILRDGELLHEYEAADLEKIPGTTTRFILAETGRAFTIRCKVKTGFCFRGNAIIFRVFIDGKFVAGILVNKITCMRDGCVRDLDGAETAATTSVPFLFSHLVVNSGATSATPQGAGEIGNIEVKTSHVMKGSRTVGKHVFDRNREARESEMNEKESKGRGLSHSVKFGASYQKQASTFVAWDYIKESPEIGSFVFLYRSLECLKAMLIVPRTPSPAPIEARNPAELSHDEIAELQRQVALQKASLTKIKLECTGKPSPRKRARITPASQVFEIGDDDEVREIARDSLVVQWPEVIELD